MNSPAEEAVPRVLAYYLPQFYPVPANDKWHGPGFTEWTKVRASEALFEGHHQPRQPHQSIGYYRLDDPQTLYKQAELMKRADISGLIFYHYWFSGEMILEKPSQLLLEDERIEMPFAFCWANESWTRRWDGGSGEVIFDQRYSKEDAEAFMNYLVPFFKDPRYIQVSGRPVLFVYRPSLIPDIQDIVEIWNAVCLAAGINTPYLVAVQTGPTNTAAQAGFSAEAQRPFYDQPELSKLPDIAPESYQHEGRVLNYVDAAKIFMESSSASLLPVIPGVVVSWDVSPRHGSKSLILEGRSPETYKRWLVDALERSAQCLSGDERLVTVNAWNEWAEGAYLEPDSDYEFAFIDATADAISEWTNRELLK